MSDLRKATLALTPNDFQCLLAESYGYSEDGLTGRIQDYIVRTFRRQIDQQLPECLVKPVVSVQLAPNITARQILERDDFDVDRIEITIDLEKGSDFEGFTVAAPLIVTGVAPPLTKAYRTYGHASQGTAKKLKHKAMATKERFTQRYIGILIPASTTGLSWSQVQMCECPPHLLHPSMEDNSKRNYIRWVCGCCGSQYLCECARGVLECLTDSEPAACLHMKEVTYREGICHFCRNTPSTLTYIDPMYGGRIHQHYLPYIRCIEITQGVTDLEAENIVREQLGIPHVGEGWVAETHLYYAVRALYPKYEVQREASPDWLGRQRFDIYLPEVQVAIEYQGQQHFRPVEFFGGEKGYQRAKQRDREKRKKSKAAGVVIVEFKYNEDITERKIQERLDKAITRQQHLLK